MVRQVCKIDMVGVEYRAYYLDKEISRGRSLVKISKALANYIKGQSNA